MDSFDVWLEIFDYLLEAMISIAYLFGHEFVFISFTFDLNEILTQDDQSFAFGFQFALHVGQLIEEIK